MLFFKKNFIYILMGIAMITWGVAWTCAKITNEYLNYNNLVFLRFVIGFISMLPFLYNKKLNWKMLSSSSIFNILLVSVLFFIYNQCFFMGTDIGKSGMGGVFVTTTNPLITFLIVTTISNNFNLKKLYAVFLGSFGGLLILDFFQLGINAFIFEGNIYFIFCSLIWGIMTVLMAKGQKHIDSIWYISLCYLITSFISLIFINPSELFDSSTYDIRFVINFFFVCSAMSFGTSIYIIASYKIGPIAASSFIFSVPFIAMSCAHVFANENLNINVIIGGIFGVLSIFIIKNLEKNISDVK